MIKIKTIYLTLFQEIAGEREKQFELKEGTKLIDLLEILTEEHGQKFKEALFDPNSGKVYHYNHITINGQLAHLLDKNFEIVLKEGDRVVIARAVSGG